MPKRLFFVLLMVCIDEPSVQQTEAVDCGALLDVRTGRLLEDQIVAFDRGLITAVGPAKSTALPTGTHIRHLPLAVCLPGLIDVHTHLLLDPTDSGYEGRQWI